LQRAVNHFSVVTLCIPVLLVFSPALKTALTLALHDDRYLQVAVAPLVCLFLIFRQRTEIFSQAHFSPRIGIPLLLLALAGAVVVFHSPADKSIRLPLAMLVVILACLAAFIFCYGTRAFRIVLYPLSCLLLTIPFPAPWMDRVAAGLQHGSASVSYALLRASGIPVLRHELLFSLPGVNFEVGPECSGIRSSLALTLVAILAGFLCLRSGWARSALILVTIPIALFKNAVRIAAISILGAYVDRVFIDGPFHHRYGGLVFSTLGTVLFVLILIGLQNIERRHRIPAGI
jgi:exosortase